MDTTIKTFTKEGLGAWLYGAEDINTLTIDKTYYVCDGPPREVDPSAPSNKGASEEYTVVGHASTTDELTKISKKIHSIYGSWIEVYDNVIVLVFGGCS